MENEFRNVCYRHLDCMSHVNMGSHECMSLQAFGMAATGNETQVQCRPGDVKAMECGIERGRHCT